MSNIALILFNIGLSFMDIMQWLIIRAGGSLKK